MNDRLLPFLFALPLGLAFACGGGGAAPVESTGGTGSSNSGGGGSLGGSGDGGAATGGSTTEPPDSLFSVCRAYVAEVCRRRAECSGGSDKYCEESGAFSCPDALFSEGSTRTLQSVKACAEEWKTFPCEDAIAWKLPACVVKGTKDDGETCTFPSQCASGECSGNVSSCGQCIPVAAPGGACEPGVTGCVPHEECQSGTCVPIAPIEAGTEDIPKALGAACTYNCVAGAICAADDSNTTRVCRPNRTKDESCYNLYTYVDTVEACSSEQADGGYPMPCDENKKCMGFAELGENCRPHVPSPPEETLAFSYCGPDLLCAGSALSYTCVAAPAPGSACLTNEGGDGCGKAETCEDGVCLTSRTLGETCGATDKCTGHTKCVAGKCAPSDELTIYQALCAP